MKITELNRSEKIIIQRVREAVSKLPYVSAIARDMHNAKPGKEGKDNSIVIDVYPHNKVAITVHVVLFHTENLTIPEIVVEIQKSVISSLNNILDKTRLKEVNVSVTGVIL